MIRKIANVKYRHWLPTIGLAAVSLLSSCQRDDLILEGQPEWLGNSIYERLEEGIEVEGEMKTFKVMLRLIDDLGEKETLSRTGSKTVFAAPDEAFDAWFKNNGWGVTSYEQLTQTQKRILMNNAMINNAYLLELMSNVSGNPPQLGLCMRRPTASSFLDTIYTMYPEEMPVNPMLNPKADAWAAYREAGTPVKVFRDNTDATMIHLLPRFMEYNDFTDLDIEILSNHQSHSIKDSWINGRQVLKMGVRDGRDYYEQTCKNGYVYVLDGVIEPARNMAEIITSNPKTSKWGSMLNRFSYLEFDEENSKRYNDRHKTNDKIYTLRYFAGKDGNYYGYNKSEIPGTDEKAKASLKFDPGWNEYMWRALSGGKDLHYDAGAMIVPSDSAVEAWWNGAGKGLRDKYVELDSVPLETLEPLMKVHQLISFVGSVPSKFGMILDDAKVDLGIKPEDVEECYMGCNGVIYVTNKVFPPASYRSVMYPAVSDPDKMGVIKYAIEEYDFSAYLNSMESQFTMLLPYNLTKSINPNNTEAKYLQYLDPYTYGQKQMRLFEFYVQGDKLGADTYLVEFDEDGNLVDIPGQLNINHSTATSSMIENRLKDLVDNSIILGKINSSQKFYQTKAGGMIYVEVKDDNITEAKDVQFAGPWQYIQGSEAYLTPDVMYDMTKGTNGNGLSFTLNGVVMTSPQSVFDVLKAHKDQDSLFLQYLTGDPTDNALLVQEALGGYECGNARNGNANIDVFDNYNYTVYIPSDAAIQALVDAKKLPTWEDYEKVEETVMSTVDLESILTVQKDTALYDSLQKVLQLEIDSLHDLIAESIHNFVLYHMQDNSIMIDGAPVSSEYESATLNPVTRRFYPIGVVADGQSITVTDATNQSYHVVRSEQNGLHNQICREYWFNGEAIYSSSHIVVHQIDGAMQYKVLQPMPVLDRLRY